MNMIIRRKIRVELQTDNKNSMTALKSHSKDKNSKFIQGINHINEGTHHIDLSMGKCQFHPINNGIRYAK